MLSDKPTFQHDPRSRYFVSLSCIYIESVKALYRSAGVAVSIKKPGVVPGISGSLVGLFCNHKVEDDLVDLIDL
jgi:hypothetical protein